MSRQVCKLEVCKLEVCKLALKGGGSGGGGALLCRHMVARFGCLHASFSPTLPTWRSQSPPHRHFVACDRFPEVGTQHHVQEEKAVWVPAQGATGWLLLLPAAEQLLWVWCSA